MCAHAPFWSLLLSFGPPPPMLSSQWYAPLVFTPLSFSLATVSLSSRYIRGRHWCSAHPYMHMCVWWVPGSWACSGCTAVPVDLHENVHVRFPGASFVWWSMCADWETAWGCVAGRCCCDRSFWCTIIVLSASPSIPFGYLVRAKSILLGCPPHLQQQTGAKGTLVSDLFFLFFCDWEW